MGKKGAISKKNNQNEYREKMIAVFKIMRDSTNDIREAKIWNDVVQFTINYN